ncbi:hypothetical protein [Nonomuraea sp. JJY05]|uniref:hypothetical protein n=1 Tax=Nonomuraea sp. JJY05 TaxID=3350255 RepID=UPI00373EC89B
MTIRILDVGGGTGVHARWPAVAWPALDAAGEGEFDRPSYRRVSSRGSCGPPALSRSTEAGYLTIYGDHPPLPTSA